MLVAKGVRLLQLLWYAWYLPKFRSSHLVQVVFTLIPSVIFFRLLKVDTLFTTVEVFILGMGLDLIGKYIAGILVSIFGADGPNKHHLFIPALEIGHVIERTTAFFVLVAGEILISVSYIAIESEIGIRDEWVRCCLGVTLAFWLCWVNLSVVTANYYLISCPSSTLTLTLPWSSVMHCAVTGSHPSLGHRLTFKCISRLVSHDHVAPPPFMRQCHHYCRCSSQDDPRTEAGTRASLVFWIW